MNPLTNILPAVWRKRAYVLYALLVLGVGATQVGYASVDHEQPTWLTAALAVLAYVGGFLGFTAASNTSEASDQEEVAVVKPDEGGAIQIDLGLIIGIIVGILVAVLVLALIGHPVTR
jgi:hypothetical protein